MGKIFEQLALLMELFQPGGVEAAQAGVENVQVGTGHHADGIHLKGMNLADDTRQVAWARGCGLGEGEPLGKQGKLAGLREGEGGKGRHVKIIVENDKRGRICGLARDNLVTWRAEKGFLIGIESLFWLN